MRPVQLLDRPIAHPFVCVKCGSQNKEHFVDLGIDSELNHVDDYGQRHLTTGVIYLCNDCFTDAIIQYMTRLFRFVNRQTVGRDLAQAQDTTRLNSLIQEINTLQGILEKRDKQILELRDQISNLQFEAAHKDEKTAMEIVATLIGEEIEDGSGSSDTDSVGSESDAEGNAPDGSGDKSEPEFDSLSVTHQAATGGFLAGAGFLGDRTG